MGTVEKLYRAFDLELSSEAVLRMKRYLEKNPQNKHGRHLYHLEQFGLDEKEIRKRYGPYCERFGLT